jgi:hypothetical protein
MRDAVKTSGDSFLRPRCSPQPLARDQIQGPRPSSGRVMASDWHKPLRIPSEAWERGLEQTAAKLIDDHVQLRTEREDCRHETSFDRCGGGRRARILRPRVGATGQPVRWQRHGHARPEPRRTGTDTLQLGPEPRRIGAVGSAHGAACGNGSLGNAAVFGKQFGDAPEAPSCSSCLARENGRASSRER